MRAGNALARVHRLVCALAAYVMNSSHTYKLLRPKKKSCVSDDPTDPTHRPPTVKLFSRFFVFAPITGLPVLVGSPGKYKWYRILFYAKINKYGGGDPSSKSEKMPAFCGNKDP